MSEFGKFRPMSLPPRGRPKKRFGKFRRVRAGLRARGKGVTTSALVNTGYEAVEPEIHVPAKLAANLGLRIEEAPRRSTAQWARRST